jgi:hypothetical protein
MMTALGTLPFLATLWLLVVLGAKVLEESGRKIAAALKGEPVRLESRNGACVRVRIRASNAPATAANVQWRAAA